MDISQTPQRPLLHYFGGKWILADWIIEHFPKHRIYVEPFGGAASVLLKKKPVFSEVYNDLDSEIFNLFTVLQDEKLYRTLHQKLMFTAYSRMEFMHAYNPTEEPVERARRLLVRSWMGRGGNSIFRKTGFCTNVKAVCFSHPVQGWQRVISHMDTFVNRLRNVTLEHVPAVDVIKGHDSPQSLFYVDPPYPLSVRSKKVYRHEMTDGQHTELVETLNSVKGMVVVSGYPCELYDDQLYKSWHRVEREHYADTGHLKPKQKRTEVLWINDAAHTALTAHLPRQLEMFPGVAS